MADRVVSVKLKADISEYTASLAKAAAATRGLSGDVDKSLKDVGPRAEKSGNDSGGLFAQGFRSGFVRNSPLIAAAVGAGLAAGAPVALAGAGVLFAGIGALAAAQTTQVRSAFTALGHEIRDGAVHDAAVLVPVYEDMASKIGDAFQRMRPEIRDAFEAAAPQIERFTDGLTGAAENALPGLVRAIEAGGPVIDGLATLMADVGTGLSNFFDAMSDNSGAAGQALEGIGTTLAAALPLLGELLGTGAELAADVLPALGSTLGLVSDVAHVLAPVLPTIAIGFASFKIAQAASGWLTSLSGSLAGVSQNLAFASYGAGNFAGAAGKLSTATSGVASGASSMADNVGRAAGALPALGIVIAGITSGMSDATTEEDKWAQAILAGGDASVQAYQQYKSGTHWGQSIDEATGLASSWDDARQKADEMRDSMSPLQLAQVGARQATADLEMAVGKYGPRSAEAAEASGVLGAAQSELAIRQQELEIATGSATATIEEATKRQEEYGASMAAFVTPLEAYTGLLGEKQEADRLAAEATAASTASSTDSWRDYATDVGVTFDEYEARLEEQVAAQANWQTNMLLLAGRVSQGTLDELARMGPEGAPLVADLVTRSDAELDHMDDLFYQRSQEATDAWAAQLTAAAPVLAEIARKGGQGASDAAAAALNNGTATLASIAAQWGISIASGVNPILAGLGKPRITTSGWDATGFMGPVQLANADGNLYEQHQAEIARGGAMRVWAEPETGGEAYIPLSPAKRGRSMNIWEETGRRLGVDMETYADGGFSSASSVPKPASTAPFRAPYSTVADTAMQKVYDETVAFMAAQVVSGGVLGAGAVGGDWQSIWNWVKARIPQATQNSTYRAGDPGYHGKGKAIDFGFGGVPGGNGSAGLALINRTLHDGLGANLAELIYDGLGDDRPDLKNGKPLTYNAATRAQHHNHVHAATYDQGGWLQPGYTMAYNGTGTPERVLTSREFGGSGGRAGSGSAAAPQVTVQFFVDGQEFRGMARAEVEHKLGEVADRVMYAGG